MLKLNYYDGYFHHHITVYGQKHGNVFLPIIHRSGSLPMIAGGKNTRDWQAPMSADSRKWGGPLPDGARTFATEAEAETYAKSVSDETTGAYCRDHKYRP